MVFPAFLQSFCLLAALCFQNDQERTDMFDGLARFNSVHNKYKEWDANPEFKVWHFTESKMLQRCVTLKAAT